MATSSTSTGTKVIDPRLLYCLPSDIKTHMPESGLSGSTSYDVMLQELCLAASRRIDELMGKDPGYFYPSTATETRYFDGNGEQELDIDPTITLTTVSVSEQGNYASSDYTAWTQNTDFYAWPYNSTSTGEPVYRLIVDHNGNKLNWTRFKKAVKVTGIFGHSLTVPPVIKEAAIAQVMRWYMRNKQAWQDAGANVEIGAMQFTQALDPEVKDMLWTFMLRDM